MDSHIVAWAITHLGLPDEVPKEVRLLSRGGSGRRYMRLSWAEGSFVVMHYDMGRKENALFVPIGNFLHQIGVPVPRILAWDEENRFILLEDLGDESLWSLRSLPPEERWALYRKTVEALIILHTYPLEAFPARDVPLMEGFDERLYRWEREYFREQFVYNLMGVTLSESEASALENELDMLAKRLNACPSCLIHRDFQSQNIMICQGKPYFIDFQGMRTGNPCYDLASLAYDPYMPLTSSERRQIVEYYFQLRNWDLSLEEFFLKVWEAAAQRLMQALGAYAFLSLVKGYTDFLNYINPGIKNLIYVTEQATSLPHLNQLALHLDRRAPGA